MGLSLLTPEILIFLSPLWLGRFLNTQEWRWLTLQHYSVSQAPILAVAAIIGLYRLSQLYKNKKSKQIFIKFAMIIIIISSVAVNCKLPGNNLANLFDMDFYQVKPEVASARKAIKLIPSDASVGVQSAFPQLTSRDKIYIMPKAIPKEQPDYIILSTKLDIWPFCSNEKVFEFKNSLEQDYFYKEIFNENGVFIIKK
jgi:uncharacterized membrane protein